MAEARSNPGSDGGRVVEVKGAFALVLYLVAVNGSVGELAVKVYARGLGDIKEVPHSEVEAEVIGVGAVLNAAVKIVVNLIVILHRPAAA